MLVNKGIVGGSPQHLFMVSEMWAVEQHPEFDFYRFLDGLSKPNQLIVYDSINQILRVKGNQLAGSHWVKALGSGLFEFRISGPQLLVRIFFTFQAGRLILLLGAYDKQQSPSRKKQQDEINRARKRLRNE